MNSICTGIIFQNHSLMHLLVIFFIHLMNINLFYLDWKKILLFLLKTFIIQLVVRRTGYVFGSLLFSCFYTSWLLWSLRLLFNINHLFSCICSIFLSHSSYIKSFTTSSKSIHQISVSVGQYGSKQLKFTCIIQERFSIKHTSVKEKNRPIPPAAFNPLWT